MWRKEYWNLLFKSPKRPIDTLYLKEGQKEKIINELGPGGQTPLMHAVLSGKIQAVKYLLKQGADVTIGEKDGYTRKSFHNISVIYIYYFI